MAFVTGNRVRETSTTTGTGTYALAGALSSAYQAFSARAANGDTCYYSASDSTGWEVGIGTWSTGNNLARTTILGSSNAGSAVSWSAGTRDIFITNPAERLLDIANIPIVLPAIQDDSIPFYDASGATNGRMLIGRMPVTYPERYAVDGEEFYTASWRFGLATQNSGTGAAGVGNVTGLPKHVGIYQWTSGTTTTGRSCAISNSSLYLFGGGLAKLSVILRIPTLSDGTDTFTIRAGFCDVNSGDGTDGVFWRYSSANNSGNWQIIATNNGSVSTYNTSIPPVANTFQCLTLVINAAGTAVAGFIDGVDVSSTITTNIPTSAGRETGLVLSILKSAGTTARTLDVDFLGVYFEFADNRA